MGRYRERVGCELCKREIDDLDPRHAIELPNEGVGLACGLCLQAAVDAGMLIKMETAEPVGPLKKPWMSTCGFKGFDYTDPTGRAACPDCGAKEWLTVEEWKKTQLVPKDA